MASGPVVVESFTDYPAEAWLRVALTSDLHFGEYLTHRQLCRFLGTINDFEPDLYLNLGDNCQGWNGFDKTAKVLRFEQESLSPSILRAGVTGNHDFWLRGDQLPYAEAKRYGCYRSDKPPEGYWLYQVNKQKQTYREKSCHNFENDGPLRVKGYTFFGYMGWYIEDGRHVHNTSNNYKYMPWHVQGVPIHTYFQSCAEKSLDRTLQEISEQDTRLVFCSHFPIVDVDKDTEGRSYGGSEVHGKILREHFGVTCFMNGHEHLRLTGPQRFSAGSDYGKPKYLLLAFPLSKL